VRFLNDMCMDVRITSWLNSHGHEATHLRDQGLQRLPNGAIFDKGIAESPVIMTFDLDFGEIVALSKGRKTGVVLFRLRNTEYLSLFNDFPRSSLNVQTRWQGALL
jgi:predicted nuclease of predicted toxin-antitoxin system